MSSPVPYKYILSLPERVIRSLAALSGGLLREIGSVALPPGIRQTTLYRTMVEVTLRFLIEEVGQVEGVYPYPDQLAQNFLLQRTASHGIEFLGILAFRASPVWVLAALADITGGGHKLIHEISQALKNEGLLDPNARFERMDQLLDGLAKTSDHLAQTLNLPPSPPCTDSELIRRAYLDLIGLPPTPAEVDAFLKDSSPDAFATVIDKLLPPEGDLAFRDTALPKFSLAQATRLELVREKDKVEVAKNPESKGTILRRVLS